MAGVSGIGSGLDINGIVTALVNAEKAPKEAQLARLQTASTTKLSALGQLKSVLGGFQAALKNLNKSSLFESRVAVSSNPAAVTATAGKTAPNGTFSLTVSQLASGSKVASAALNGTYTTGGAGTLMVKVGSADPGIEVSIPVGASLTQVRDTLNVALKDSGVSANLVANPSDGATRLVLSSSNTGVGKDIEVISSDAGLSDLTIGAGSPGSMVLEAAANAKFSIDGLALESDSNEVGGAINGVTFKLLVADPEKALTVSVGQDREGVIETIKAFVEAYNKLITTSNSLTRVTSTGEGSAPTTGGLVGDATMRSLLGAVRNELVNPAVQEGVRILADLGIGTAKNGTLSIDEGKLNKTLTDNFDSVAAFFTGDSGLMSRLNQRIDGYIQTGGVIEQRMKGLETIVRGISDQKETLARRIDQLQARLFAKFNTMDALVGQLSQTSERLGQALSSLPGLVKKD